MTIFEQQNLGDLRRNGYVQITNPEAAKTLLNFIEENFNYQFPYGLKLILGVGFYGNDNYIIHTSPKIIEVFKPNIQTRITYYQTQINKLVTALDTLR